MTSPLRIALLIASTRQGRYAPTIVGFVSPLIAGRDDVELDVVDLLEADLPAHFTREPPAATVAAIDQIARADGVVVVVPEYNHSFPASLKQFIDLSGPAWARKAVSFVAYGGLSGGLRAVEHLRGVIAEVRAATIRETVSFHGFPFNETGMLDDPAAATAAVTTMMDDLVWWADALRAARERS